MLAALRKFAGTWPARIFFLILVASFASWGIADVVRRIGSGGDDLVTMAGGPVTVAEFQEAYQRDLRRMTQMLPDASQLPPQLREQVARETLNRLATLHAVDAEVARLGITVPDAALRQAVFDMPAFKGPNGQFDRAQFNQVLQNNNLTEARFLTLMRQDLAQRQLMESLQAGVAAPAPMTDRLYTFLNEKRVADYVALPLTGVAQPPPPPEGVLRRYYDNNPARYTAPEYRRVRAIILSPQTIARTLDLSDADLRAWWEAHKGEFQTVEKRSAQVVTAPNADAAAAILALWKSGANWEAVQAAAQAHGATAVALDDTTPAGVPSPDLARAIFSAPQDAVEGPVVEPLGVQVFKVTRITPAAHPGFEQMKETIRQRLGEERAADLIDQRAQKLQDVIAGGATLDEIPADLGAAAVAGTLDEKGNTTEGVPAPLPGTPALRSQVIADAFRLTPGEPLKVTEGPDHAYYVLQVQSITKPAAKPFEAVREQVLKDWTAEQVRHTEEALAAKLLGLIKSGQSLTSAAWGSGLSVQRTPPLERGRPAPGLPAELVEKVFALHVGEPTMVETNQGFVVAVLAAIERPDLRTDKLGVERVQQELTRSLAQDVVGTYASALRDRANPRVNQRLLEQVIQQ